MPPITTNPPLPHAFLDTSSLPTPTTILLVSQYLSFHLPPELVDLILSYAEFWAHSTTTLNEPVRAFGPFTWGWREGDSIDYLKVWCPSGPGYAHRWRRWGESRRDDGFLLRSGPIGLLEEEEDENGKRGRWSPSYLQKGQLARLMFSLYQKSAAAGLRMCCRCQTKRNGGPRGPINSISPSSRTAAVRKIVFETWSHQDYFGAVTSSTTTDDDAAQQSPRVFCDVSIHRKRDATPRAARWKGRVLRWRQRGNANDIANDNDDDNENEKSGPHGKLITHKPFPLSTSSHPRHYIPHYHIHMWRYDDDNTTPSTPQTAHQTFPTAQEFLRQLEVGDTIGVWGRVGKGETYHIIDTMRMHVFWAV